MMGAADRPERLTAAEQAEREAVCQAYEENVAGAFAVAEAVVTSLQTAFEILRDLEQADHAGLFALAVRRLGMLELPPLAGCVADNADALVFARALFGLAKAEEGTADDDAVYLDAETAFQIARVHFEATEASPVTRFLTAAAVAMVRSNNAAPIAHDVKEGSEHV